MRLVAMHDRAPTRDDPMSDKIAHRVIRGLGVVGDALDRMKEMDGG